MKPDEPVDESLREVVQRKLSIGQTVRAVAWSFLGIRRGADHRNDMARLNPVHVIIAGVIGAGLFITSLVLLVRWIVTSGAAS